MMQRRGRHKIFIGMAPGVGKTFKMLEEAQYLKDAGIDVVIALLETHGREETAEQAAGLEQIPRHFMACGEQRLPEMDTEAIIQRSPKLALIDELAHTNAPGSVREKRYQDVEVILAAGIDVYSTVNIQHIESLNDLVAQITGVVVRERIPDRILEEANEIVVVDVTPETLEERLLEGKIYAPEKIQTALANFFQRRHLIALRELALREVADTVEEDGNHTPLRSPTWSIHERVMVCVSTYSHSLRLLRRAGRIANYMNAELIAIFVDKPDVFLTKAETLHLDTCERLCREFGGQFIRVTSANSPQAIADMAEQKRITQIVIGEGQQARWPHFFRRSFTQRLMDLIWHKNIDLHIIATEK